MKRLSNIILFILLVVIYWINNIYAQSEENLIFDIDVKMSEENVKIAEKNTQIAPEKINIKLNSSSKEVFKEIEFKSNGLTVSNASSSKFLSSDTMFKAKVVSDIYVDNSISYYSLLQAETQKSDFDFVYTKDFNEFKIADMGNKYIDKENDAIAIYDSKGKPLIIISSNSNIFFESNDFTPVEVFGKKYRGSFKFINNSSSLSIINYINIEEYLLGVVPKEMPALWNIEALKAQTVAARSFAYSNYEKFIKSGFNLTDDTRSQAYGGISAEHENSTKAVNETKGIVAYYDGKIAELIYNASSGGKTESSRNIWKTQKPYLIAQDDPYSIGNPYDKWELMLTSKEIEKILENIGKNIGTLQDITIDQVTSQGYVLSITFMGSISNESFNKDAIRGIFGYSKLKSLRFDMSKSSDTYKFIGSGYGHGVGMSQYGAKAMAEQGNDYKTILEFYYPKVSIEKIK